MNFRIRRGSRDLGIYGHPKILGPSKKPIISAWKFQEKTSKENDEKEKVSSISTTHHPTSKVGFGVAFQISKLIGKFRRRNSPVKLPPLREYVHDHEDPLGIVPVLPV